MGEQNFYTWLGQGIDKGWVSSPVCNSHDGPPMTDHEEEEWEEGLDPCIVVLRVWNDESR